MQLEVKRAAVAVLGGECLRVAGQYDLVQIAIARSGDVRVEQQRRLIVAGSAAFVADRLGYLSADRRVLVTERPDMLLLHHARSSAPLRAARCSYRYPLSACWGLDRQRQHKRREHT